MSNLRNVKFLIVHNKDPKFHDLFTQQVNNVILNTFLKIKAEPLWCIFPAHDTIYKPIQHSDFIDVRKYQSIKNMIEEIKPDAIIINGSLDFHNVIMSIAAKQFHIPLIVFFFRNFELTKSRSTSESIRSRLRILFKYDIEPTKENNSIGSRELRKFYIQQISYMIKNFRSLGHGIMSTLIFLIQYLNKIFFEYSPLDKIISGDLNFCTNEYWKNRLLSKKFDAFKIFIIGDPYFDHLYNEISINKERNIVKEEKIKILFCTSTMHEHGLCSKKDEYDLIKSTIKQLSQKNDYEISLKIHPSTSFKDDYESNILNEIPKKINLFQNENLVELIKKHHIMLTYGGTGAIHYGILLGMPVVNLNYNTNATSNNVFVDDSVITQCKNPESLIESIEAALRAENTQEKIDVYVEKYLGIFDGNSSKRCSDIIQQFLMSK